MIRIKMCETEDEFNRIGLLDMGELDLIAYQDVLDDQVIYKNRYGVKENIEEDKFFELYKKYLEK